MKRNDAMEIGILIGWVAKSMLPSLSITHLLTEQSTQISMKNIEIESLKRQIKKLKRRKKT